jgi:hypothetical protein
MRRRMLPAAGPLYLFVVAYPLLWAAGFAYVAWPLAALLFGLPLLLRQPVRVPPWFGLWLAFLMWMLLSGTQLDSSLRVALFGWRASVYLAATVVFLWIFNLPRPLLSDRSAAGPMVLLWAFCVVGGVAGVLWPSLAWHSVAESVLPHSITADSTGHAFVHPALTDTKFRALGHAVGRPKALFAYTNQWGAAVGVLTPFAIVAYASASSRLRRALIGMLLTISVVPIVISLNRGLWIALLAALLYLGLRLALQGNARLLLEMITVIAIVAVAVTASPLGSTLHERLSSANNSNGTRAAIYRETVDQVRSSPLFGFGSPRPTTSDLITGAHVGTQGQVYLVLFSHGIPGLVLFVGFFAAVFVRSCRGALVRSSAWNIVLVIAAVEMFFYDFIPTTMVVVMIAAALASRAAVAGDYATVPTSDRRRVGAPGRAAVS